jgi:hypothetical protein
MSSHFPFCRIASLAAPALAALVLLTPAQLVPARAQAAQAGQQAALSDSAKSDNVKAPVSQTTGTGNAASADQANQPQPRSLTARAVDKVKEVAKSASDIFNRVPCLPPKGGAKSMGSLPHVASKLISGQPVVIVAFGSSSTNGYGATSPEFTYPNRLAAQLHRRYPGADITIINRGKGGDDAPEMMKRLQSEPTRCCATSIPPRPQSWWRRAWPASRPPAPIWCWSIRNILRRSPSAGKAQARW